MTWLPPSWITLVQLPDTDGNGFVDQARVLVGLTNNQVLSPLVEPVSISISFQMNSIDSTNNEDSSPLVEPDFNPIDIIIVLVLG